MANPRVCKVLNVAEKNDAAREISKIMAGGRVQRVNTVSNSWSDWSHETTATYFREKDSLNSIRFMNLTSTFLGK